MGFSHFNLHPDILAGLMQMGFAEPTPVQAQVIPEALLGKDLKASAQTGTGKTCAFVIPILHRLLQHPLSNKPNVLVVVPTRELATQVSTVMLDTGKFTKIKTALILGGTDFERQVRRLRSGCQVVVATPGRLLDHVRQGTLSLNQIHTLVLDEADRMLDMGFLPDIRRILENCPPQMHTMLFSATFPREIENLAQSFLRNPVEVAVSTSVASENITQMIYPVSRSQKEAMLQAVLELENMSTALIFCKTKNGADHVASLVEKMGKTVTTIHSNKTQAQRDLAIAGFKKKEFQILVATDIAARGIDIKDISHVINFDVPEHAEDYVHRIGRTGRAEATGEAITLVAPDEEPYMKRIEKLIGKTLPRSVIPDFPYLVPPKLISKPKALSESFGSFRRKIPMSRRGRFK